MKKNFSVRKKLGLSQQEFAQFLQISRSLLLMYEMGKRELPTSALQQLAGLEIFCNRLPQSLALPTPLELSQPLNQRATILKIEKELQFKLLKTERNLAKMEAAFQQSLLLFNAVSSLELPKHWLTHALKGLEKNSLDKQFQLRFERETIRFQLSYLSGMRV